MTWLSADSRTLTLFGSTLFLGVLLVVVAILALTRHELALLTAVGAVLSLLIAVLILQAIE